MYFNQIRKWHVNVAIVRRSEYLSVETDSPDILMYILTAFIIRAGIKPHLQP